jgi:hypothetical protein
MRSSRDAEVFNPRNVPDEITVFRNAGSGHLVPMAARLIQRRMA